MEIYKIVKDTNKDLRKRCELVEESEMEETKKTLLEMLEYLKMSQDEKWAEENDVRGGVGLAAPQIGINKCFFAIYITDDENKVHQYGFINPKIISESTKEAYLKNGEGCLSVDEEHKGFIYRPNKITVKGYNVVTDKIEEHVFTGYESIVFQHENDHLKGILFYDHINKKDPFFVKPGSIEL